MPNDLPLPPIVAAPTFWVDVEDLFDYVLSNPRPSGIQRLSFELCGALRTVAGSDRVRFVRHLPGVTHEVTWDHIARLFEGLSSRRDGSVPRVATGSRSRPSPTFERLPLEMRRRLYDAAILQRGAIKAARDLVNGRDPGPVIIEQDHPDLGAAPGDWLLALGAAWTTPDYPAILDRLKARYGVKVALLTYDLIPVRRPEWCARYLVDAFEAWAIGTLPRCDRLLAISQATAHDVTRYMTELGISAPARVTAVPVGTGFGLAGMAETAGPVPPGLPAPGSYVLFVSTLEARKNHALLFRVWRRLLEDLPAERVPTLVFAGRVGWLVADLMQQLDNAAWLGGKVRLVRDPSDAELLALYRGCQFTLFPSLFEGWGLPVTESLALGRPCLAANVTSLPEAGGALARYFDPNDLNDAYRAVRAVLDDPEGLARWRTQVAEGFVHVPWQATAAAIVAALEPAA